jgi:hypothetical protein
MTYITFEKILTLADVKSKKICSLIVTNRNTMAGTIPELSGLYMN